MEKEEIHAFWLRSAMQVCKQGLKRSNEKVQSISSSMFRDLNGIQRRKDRLHFLSLNLES